MIFRSDSSMFGIPFEGYDSYQNGKGGMKGVIGKLITIFNETGPEMDKACLVTFLAESLFIPSVLLEEYITMEAIDDYHVKANIAYEGHEASGIFQFNKNYEMVCFKTDDRAIVNTDGTIEYVPWSSICGDYKQYENGLNLPTKFQAVWNYSNGDFVYFDGMINNISYEE